MRFFFLLEKVIKISQGFGVVDILHIQYGDGGAIAEYTSFWYKLY